jgi:hypothetical protein
MDSTPDASKEALLAQVADEAREGMRLVREVVDLLAAEAPSRDSRALGEFLDGIDAIALQARLLSLEAALLAGAEFGPAAAGIAELADRCGKALRALGLLRRSIEKVEAQRGAKLARRTSPMPPPDTLPSTIS